MTHSAHVFRKLKVLAALVTIVFVMGSQISCKTADNSHSGGGSDKLAQVELSFHSRDGRTYQITAAKLATPYVVRYHDVGYAYDMTNCMDVLDALASSAGREPNFYRSLMDENMQREMDAIDEEKGGQVFGNSEKGKPFPSSAEWQSVITYWVDVPYAGNHYRVMVGKDIIDGEESPATMVTLVLKDNRWLQSTDLEKSELPVEFAAGGYEGLTKPITQGASGDSEPIK